MPRQNFSSGLAELDRANCADKKGHVENESDDEYDPTGHEPYLCAQKEFVEVVRGHRMQIDLQIPTKCQKTEQPDVVTTQSPTDRFPNANRKMRSQQICGEM